MRSRRPSGATRRAAAARPFAATWSLAARLLLAAATCLAATTPAVAAPPDAATSRARPATSAARASIDVPDDRGRTRVFDDRGRTLALERAPVRIVSLAPHATELLDAAGLRERIVAVDANSDAAWARALPRVAAHPAPDVEALLALRPDLVVVWGPGAGADRVARMAELGLAVFVSDPRTVAQVADQLETFAQWARDPAAGRAAARRMRERASALRESNAGLPAVPVAVIAWERPLTALGNADIVGDLLSLCGARNVFDDAPIAAPHVDVEEVLRRRPRVVLTLQHGALPAALTAGEAGRAITVVPLGSSTALRPAPRVVDTAQRICRAIAEVR